MIRRSAIAATILVVGATAVHAQGKYPERPITIVVPSAPGGTTDFSARLIAEPLSRALGQPVVVDNKPGASGNIGGQVVARAKPDGYTLLLAYSGYQVGNPHLFAKAGWDPIKDFTPVAKCAQLACPVMGAPARLHRNNTTLSIREERHHLCSLELQLGDFPRRGIYRVQLKVAFGNIQSDHSKHGGLLGK